MARGHQAPEDGGVALCHQVTTLDRAKLTERLRSLPSEAMAQVEDGLRAALDFP
jgi:mRNA-degrading endonuclease toxin of MazEF toxin-antitoxin module